MTLLPSLDPRTLTGLKIYCLAMGDSSTAVRGDAEGGLHTLAELTGHSPETVWAEFVRWCVESLHHVEFGSRELPDELCASVRFAASLTGTTDDAVWHASASCASAIVPYFR